MEYTQEQAKEEFVPSIALDIILTLITCGIYNLYMQYRQMEAANYMLNLPKYSFGRWLLLTIVTCGIYHVYHEYILSRDIFTVIGQADGSEPILHVVLSLFGLSVVADALQQNAINKHFGKDTL